MSSLPGKQEHSDKSPAGGATVCGSTRTPRRVQWEDTRVDHCKASSPPRSIHELDELGLDPSAFEELKNALEKHRCEVQGTAASSVQSSPTTDEFGHLSSSTLVVQRPQEAWMDPLEREGLPRSPPAKDSHASSKGKRNERLVDQHAEESVRTHTRHGWGGFHRSSNKQRVKDLENEAGLTDVESQRSSQVLKGLTGSWLGTSILPHPEDRRSSQTYGPKLGSGLLSALLALYSHEHDRDDVRSIMSGESINSNVGNEDGVDILPKPPRLRIPDQGDMHERFASPGSKDSKEKPLGKLSLGRSLKLGSASASSIIPHIRSPCLPASSTAAALIVGASTLSGIATPRHATLAPNLEKPGYHLMRYTVEEEAPRAVSRTPSMIFRGLRRAHSTDSELTVTGPRVSEERDVDITSRDSPTPSVMMSRTPSMEVVAPRPKRGQTFPLPPGERKGWAGRMRDGLPMQMSPTRRKPLPLTITVKGLDTPYGSGAVTPLSPSSWRTPVDEYGEKKCHFDLKRIERETKRIEERERREWLKHREKEMRQKRRKAEIYITKHVAEILQRQEFILKLARSMIMFGGPSHRLASQIQSTGRVLDLELSCMYLPDVMLISFEDSATGTSNVKFIRQGSALDLEKLGEAHSLYWNVIHDNMSVSVASASLDVLMRRKPVYNTVQLTLIGAMCSASICSVSFSGSFIDCLVSAPLGGLLVAIQLTGVRNELYAHVFEITIATLLSFLSAALASTKHFCYSAVASSSVVLILPGYIVLTGSLELSSRSLVAGAVRICFAVMYSLFLGFGLAIGAELYQDIVGRQIVGPTDYACVVSHDPLGPWWQRTPSLWWAFLTVPLYSLSLSLRLMAPWWKKELVLAIAIASLGWVTNHFVGTRFPNESDISAACGAFVVGFVSNMYGRFFNGNAFIVMITGILFQVPSGLGKGGLLKFASDHTLGSQSTFLNGFDTATQLIAVALGLTVGLGISLVVVHPVQSRRRAGGLFSL